MVYRFAFATFLMPGLPSCRGPVNAMHGKATTLDHTFKDVITPNADTPYSLALLDLRAELVVLQVPAVSDRYYVWQFEDLFGTNPHFFGSHATGSKAGTYLAVGPGWECKAGYDFDGVLPFDTDLVFIIDRTQLIGAEDVPALSKVIKGYSIQPLSVYLGQNSPAVQPVDWPGWNDEASRDERFIDFLNFLLSVCQPVHTSETDLMACCAQVGIGAGLPFNFDALSDNVRDAFRAGVAEARAPIASRVENISQKINGWASSNIFGTHEWYAGDYLLRAAAAIAGWGGNDAGEALEGAQRYQITFPSLPPAKAFWSVTMYDISYDGTAGYLVENPINRYLINSTTAALVYGEDGSLTIPAQHAQPQEVAEIANWLPAPEGPFYQVLRIYWPEKAALEGEWNPPPIVRVG
jgi:hypothetical protein